MKANYIYKRKDGGTTDCYGYVEETSNFSLVCDNEYNDGIVSDYEGASNWESVCKYLETRYNGQIEEITVIVIN